jgi:hypothetical protein
MVNNPASYSVDSLFESRKVFVLGGVKASVLAIGTKVRGFNPSRGRSIFKGDRNPQHPFLRRGSKAGGPM